MMAVSREPTGPRKRVAGYLSHHGTYSRWWGLVRRMRRPPWVLRSSRAASSRAQSLLPSRGKASDRARLASVRSVRVFPRFLRLVAAFRPEIRPKVVGCTRECTREPHGDTRDTRWKLVRRAPKDPGAIVVFISV